MKNYLLLSFICLILTVTPTQAKQLPFFKGSLEELKQEAYLQDKPFFVYFYAKKSGICRKMDKGTWKHPDLIDYVEDNYIAYRMDAFDVANRDLVNELQIKQIPTIAIFSPKGNLKERLEGNYAPLTLLSELEKHSKNLNDELQVVFFAKDNPETRAESTADDQQVPASGYYNGNVSRGMDSPSQDVGAQQGFNSVIVTTHQSTSQYRSFQTEKASTVTLLADGKSAKSVNLSVTGFEQYSPIELLNREDAATIGILIGNFTTRGRLMEEVARFDRIWRYDIWVYSVEIDDKTHYKLVLGTYEEEDDAKVFAKVIHKFERLNTEIIDLSDILIH
ncbi:MAG: thioredoxin family protein [Bacteroidota bacterium]